MKDWTDHLQSLVLVPLQVDANEHSLIWRLATIVGLGTDIIVEAIAYSRFLKAGKARTHGGPIQRRLFPLTKGASGRDRIIRKLFIGTHHTGTRGDTRSTKRFGILLPLRTGQYLVLDDEKAACWYERAASKNDPKALYN